MNLINRNFDIVSKNEDLEYLYCFKNFPVFMGCVDQDPSSDIFQDMIWNISKSSGMIQLNPLVPLEVVYQSEHNPGTTGKAWMDHHTAFSNFILKYNPKAVYEIGGSHGTLCNLSLEKNKNLEWTIIEPNPVNKEGIKGKVIKGFFTKDTKLPTNVDTIVHSHVFEHIYDPEKFVESLQSLPLETKIIFSVPPLRIHLEKKFTNTLNFEHTFLCSESYIEHWFSNFELIEKYYYNDDFAIFYVFQKKKNFSKKSLAFPKLYKQNKKLYLDYIEYHKDLINKINTKIENHNHNVFLFGGHAFSQFLISFGLNNKKIKCILDNSPLKQNKRLYGTNLKVYSPSILKDEINPLVILRSGVFNNEIKQDIINNINPSTSFIEEV